MTVHSTAHGTFTIERVLPAKLSRVYEAWSVPSFKRAWFACHEDWPSLSYTLEFRAGGREHSVVVGPQNVQHVFDAIYLDVVPDYRIVYAYEMSLGERKISASLATVVFEAASGGRRTKLTFTEQAVFLDGYDGLSDRQRGTELQLDSLERWLGRMA